MREDVGKDMDAVLEKVSKMGFAGVEFYGNGYSKYNGKAKELRKKLDDLKLKSEGIHIKTAALRGDELKQSIETSKILGTRFLIVAGDGDFTDPEKSKALAETFNKAAEALKPLGMACGYHNHTAEFKKDGDKTYWDLFAERTSKDVMLQLDVGHAAAAGVDPVELIKKHPGRTGTAHFAPKRQTRRDGQEGHHRAGFDRLESLHHRLPPGRRDRVVRARAGVLPRWQVADGVHGDVSGRLEEDHGRDETGPGGLKAAAQLTPRRRHFTCVRSGRPPSRPAGVRV